MVLTKTLIRESEENAVKSGAFSFLADLDFVGSDVEGGAGGGVAR